MYCTCRVSLRITEEQPFKLDSSDDVYAMLKIVSVVCFVLRKRLSVRAHFILFPSASSCFNRYDMNIGDTCESPKLVDTRVPFVMTWHEFSRSNIPTTFKYTVGRNFFFNDMSKRKKK